MERTEQELVRIGKLAKLRAGSYPFPNDVPELVASTTVIESVEREEALDPGKRRVVTVAGRLMTIRLMGKAAFAHFQDRSGRLQLYVKRDDVGDESFEAFKNFDLGDIVQATGFAFRTKTGEPSLHVSSIRLLVKCLRPLPEKWHGLTDVELRYRQRYVDLIVNPDVRDTFAKRAKIISAIRRFFDERDYLEVETPVMHSVASGALAKPFVTHHNALGLDLYLRIALELHLKRLVVGGYERVYEMSRVFRNEGISTQHNPEFTMIEFYQAYATYETLMALTEELITSLVNEIHGTLKIVYGEQEVNFARPWARFSMVDAIYEFGHVPRSIDLLTLGGVQQAGKQLRVTGLDAIRDYGKALYEIFDHSIEDKIVNPTFVTKHPTSISPLARPALDDERFTDRFELIVCGMELANAFSELNDAEDQRARMYAQVEAREAGDEEAMAIDEDFLAALEYGMPPTAGEGIGIDRLIMLLTNQQSIRDVILFPQMRPLDGGERQG